jgi:hypothetical protein
MLLAAPAGAISGGLLLLGRMLATEASLKHVGLCLAGNLEDVGRVLITDALIGLASATVLAFLGISHPSFIISAYQWSPAFAWVLVGAFAPLASLGSSALSTGGQLRMYQSTARGSQQGSLDLKAVQTFLNSLKKSPSRRILDQLWVIWRQEEDAYKERVQAIAYQSFHRGSLLFSSLWSDIEGWYERTGDDVPAELRVIDVRRVLPDRDGLRGAELDSETLELVDGLVTLNVLDPLSAALGYDRQAFRKWWKIHQQELYRNKEPDEW